MPGDPLGQAERNVFGANSYAHEVTGLPIETGRGALPPDAQARQHLITIEAHRGKEVADAMRKKMGIPTTEEIAAKAKAEAEAKAKAEQDRFDAAVEKKAKELLAEAEKARTPLQ